MAGILYLTDMEASGRARESADGYQNMPGQASENSM